MVDLLAQPKNRTLTAGFIVPLCEFLMVGGATFFVFPLVYLASSNSTAMQSLAGSLFLLSFFVNAPHFMHSYQLLYANYFGKVKEEKRFLSRLRYLHAGVIVPVLLVVFLLYGYAQGVHGKDPQVLAYILNAMFFLVGWHYVKQGYGVLITLSVRNRIFYSATEKNLLLYNAYIVWLAAWILTNGTMAREQGYALPMAVIHFPSFVTAFSVVIACLTSLAVLVALINKSRKGALSWNGLTGYFCSLYAWTLLIILYPVFILVIPALHSLQYLLFAWKLAYEKDKSDISMASKVPLIRFLAIGFLTGIMFFALIPMAFDKLIPYDHDTFGSGLFFILFIVFINVHHYFIDSAIWRKENPDMKYLYQ